MMRVVNKNQIIENNRQKNNKQNIKQEILKSFRVQRQLQMKFDMRSLIEIGKGFKSSKNERIQSIVHANINVFVKACYKSLNNL
jgi:hypothetical protein